MARGRSVVVSAAAGMRESVPPDAGAVVPVEDVRALSGALIERLADPAAADGEGRNGRRYVELRHDLRRTIAALDRAYSAALPGQ
jgi:glycosyltransferase involved in cell wall biosynthesis